MLHSLYVKNFALIEELHFQPENALNVMTGETGAGKSIILGALGLVLGNRSETSALHHITEKCIVEAVFSADNSGIIQFFKDKELDMDKEIILRREISVSGKSRAFINDTPVTLNDLRELGSMLIEIHTQNTNLLIKEPLEQLHLIDDFGTPRELLEKHALLWNNYAENKRQLEELRIKIQKAIAEKDYLQFQFDELDKYTPVAGEDDVLQQRANTLEHAAEITESGFRALDLLSESEDSVYSKIQQVRAALKNSGNYHGEAAAVLGRLDSMLQEIKEMEHTLRNIAENTDVDSGSLEAIQSRIANLQMLLRKHQVNSSSDLVKIFNELNEKLMVADRAEEQREALEGAVQKSHAECLRSAENLHEIRVRIASELCKNAVLHLQKLGMPKAKLSTELQYEESALNGLGATKAQLLFNANGSKELPLEKVASGGEVSRLNFCFKSILAGKKSMPTIIFDEADTGVSGEIAKRFGEMMNDLGKFHQVITITHLPQVAAKGKTHFLVYKTDVENVAMTQIRKLSEVEKIENIAGMLSGRDPGDAALAAAKELLGL